MVNESPLYWCVLHLLVVELRPNTKEVPLCSSHHATAPSQNRIDKILISLKRARAAFLFTRQPIGKTEGPHIVLTPSLHRSSSVSILDEKTGDRFTSLILKLSKTQRFLWIFNKANPFPLVIMAYLFPTFRANAIIEGPKMRFPRKCASRKTHA